MTEPADEMHVSLTDCRGRNHDGDNSHERSLREPEVMTDPKVHWETFTQIMRACRGLPIALIIIGSSLKRKLFSDNNKMAIMRLESSRKHLHPGSFVTIPAMICRFWESDGHNFDIKSLDPTKMTQAAYNTLVDIIEFLEISRLHKLFLRAMILCLIALKVFLGLMVESSDSKAKIQEIKAKIQDKFNYNGNCKVKIGIIPDPGGEFKACVTPFLRFCG